MTDLPIAETRPGRSGPPLIARVRPISLAWGSDRPLSSRVLRASGACCMMKLDRIASIGRLLFVGTLLVLPTPTYFDKEDCPS